MTDEATARIAQMAEQNRQALDLARLLSFAVPIEPALMRAMRIELLPEADVSAEADLWFGPLAQTRSRDGIMLFPDVAETLRAGLKDKLAERCWRITERLHDYLPPAVQLEERLNFLSIDAAGNAREIGELLKTALTALIGRERDEVANWAGRALPRLPQAVRATEGAAMLAVASDLRLGRGFTLAEHLGGGPIPDWLAAVLPAGLATAALGVSATSLGLMLDPAPGPQALQIMLPATDPRVVQISAGGETRVIFIDVKGTAQHVPIDFGAGPVELTTLAGEAFTIDRIAIRGTSPDRRLACAAYANCNQALIVWQIAAPIEGCLGFALERIDADGNSEFLKNAIGFARTSPKSAPQPSTVWPIQRFIWIDRPPLRGMPYSYRITPVIGVPDKVELLRDPETLTNPVDLAADRQGPIRGVFNRQPSASPQQSKTESHESAAQDQGGEVRRALVSILNEARADESTVYAALFLLDDPELIQLLAALGPQAHIVLSREGQADDGGRLARALKLLSRAVYVRSKAGRLTDTNFMVVCDSRAVPKTVWTGSVNWTSSSLNGQDSNALIIEHRQIAARYFQQWQRLHDDLSITPLAAANAKPSTFTMTDGSSATLRFAPVRNGIDLADVRRHVESARSAILFAVGPRASRSIVDDILRLSGRRSGRLHVAGVARSFAGKQVTIHHHGNEVAVTPDRVPNSAFDDDGPRKNAASLPIGSRLIVIDPFSDSPVVITGSHTFSESASRKNDEDLLIIVGERALAAQCAVHIQGLIDHYAFRARTLATKASFSSALRADDGWQQPFMTGEREKEIRFWMGTLSARPSAPQASRAPDLAPRSKRPASAGKAPAKKARSSAKSPGGFAKKKPATKKKAAKKQVKKQAKKRAKK
jgi:hypothetical protein